MWKQVRQKSANLFLNYITISQSLSWPWHTNTGLHWSSAIALNLNNCAATSVESRILATTFLFPLYFCFKIWLLVILQYRAACQTFTKHFFVLRLQTTLFVVYIQLFNENKPSIKLGLSSCALFHCITVGWYQDSVIIEVTQTEALNTRWTP